MAGTASLCPMELFPEEGQHLSTSRVKSFMSRGGGHLSRSTWQVGSHPVTPAALTALDCTPPPSVSCLPNGGQQQPGRRAGGAAGTKTGQRRQKTRAGGAMPAECQRDMGVPAPRGAECLGPQTEQGLTVSAQPAAHGRGSRTAADHLLTPPAPPTTPGPQKRRDHGFGCRVYSG